MRVSASDCRASPTQLSTHQWRFRAGGASAPMEPLVQFFELVLGWPLVRRTGPILGEGEADPREAEISLLIEQKAYGEVLERLNLLEQDRPDQAWIHYKRGVVLRISGNLLEALASYEKALRLDSDYPAAMAHYGYTLHLLGDSSRAVNVLNLQLAVNPGDRASIKIQRMIARQVAEKMYAEEGENEQEPASDNLSPGEEG